MSGQAEGRSEAELLQAWKGGDAAAANVLTKELRSKGMPDGAGDKKLALSIIHAETARGWAISRGIVKLAVTTGDGYQQTYEANVASGRSMHVACEAAIVVALEQLLNDAKIQEYLRL